MLKNALGLTGSAAIFFLALSCGTSSSSAPSTTTDSATTPVKLDVPMGKAALLPWLNAKSYASWPKETKTHVSEGPHGERVLTHIHPTLDASLKAKSAEHPMGAAMVKEIYGTDGATVVGWAVAQKTEATSAAGANWYWFEVLSPDAAPEADGKNVKLCVACHQGGTDFVLSPYPLQ